MAKAKNQQNNANKPPKHKVSDSKVGSFGGSFKKGENARPEK